MNASLSDLVDVPIRLGLAPAEKFSSQVPQLRRLVPDPAAALRHAVLERDHHVCRCCGFRSLKHQEVLDLKAGARDLDSVVTACNFCHQCFDLDLVTAMRSGVLVWLPELDQATLHHAARDIYRARLMSGTAHSKAQLVLDRLISLPEPEQPRSWKSRREEVKERLGTDNPAELAKRLRDGGDHLTSSSLPEFPGGVRLLPLDRRIIRQDDIEFNQFPGILKYWHSPDGPFRDRSAYPWLDLIAAKLATDEVIT